MSRGPLGGPRPFAQCELKMTVDISKGALDKIEEGKRDVTEKEVAEIEDQLRNMVMKSIGTGPGSQKIDVRNAAAKGNIEIFLGDVINRVQIRDIENVMERMGFKIATYHIEGA